MEFVIVTPEKQQLVELVSLKRRFDRESGWDPPKGYLEEWSKALEGIYRQDPNLVKLALVNGEIVGYCISVKRLHSYDGVVMDVTWKNAYIWETYVVDEYRGRGVGTALTTEAISYLTSIGVEKVSLIVNSWNKEARKFYEKLGFDLWGYLLLKRI